MTLVSVFFLALAFGLIIAVNRHAITDQTLQRLANIATLVSLIFSIVFGVPALVSINAPKESIKPPEEKKPHFAANEFRSSTHECSKKCLADSMGNDYIYAICLDMCQKQPLSTDFGYSTNECNNCYLTWISCKSNCELAIYDAIYIAQACYDNCNDKLKNCKAMCEYNE